VAQALVHKPALLILDEPTSGLDPVQIVEMRSLIRGLRGEHTILVSSHILSEISQTCDRLLVIQAGEIIAKGSEAELAQRMGGGGMVEIDVRGGAEPALGIVQKVAGVTSAKAAAIEGGATRIQFMAASEVRPAIVRALVGGGVDVLRVDRGAAQLESIFLRLTQGTKDLAA
jgi:ABC-2 type transport system ATP-binding protein